jgi:hypothetical protein
MHIAKLYAYALEATGARPSKEVLEVVAYPNIMGARIEKDITDGLCHLLANMDEATMNRVVYNGRDARSRRLADWWDENSEAALKAAENAKQILRTARGASEWFEASERRKHPNVGAYCAAADMGYNYATDAKIVWLKDGVIIESYDLGLHIIEGKLV